MWATRSTPPHTKREALDHDLAELDTRLRGAAKAWGEQPMLASHPVYQYLADAYGLRIESMHFEPDQALSPEDLQALDALLARHPAKLMLWEAPPLPETEEQLRAGASPPSYSTQPPNRHPPVTSSR